VKPFRRLAPAQLDLVSPHPTVYAAAFFPTPVLPATRKPGPCRLLAAPGPGLWCEPGPYAR